MYHQNFRDSRDLNVTTRPDILMSEIEARDKHIECVEEALQSVTDYHERVIKDLKLQISVSRNGYNKYRNAYFKLKEGEDGA